MEIKHLRYFIAIIESNYNLLEASKKLFISQPGLSKMLNSFEKRENIILFERSQGRLNGLTPAGKLLYDYAQHMLEQYDDIMKQLQEASTKLKGKIKIGIPPFVLSTVLSEIMIELIINNSDIQIEIVQLGAYELRKSLILKEVDIAILITPTTMNPEIIEETPLFQDEFCAFMDRKHALASSHLIPWSDFDRLPVALYDKTFMSHHQLHQAFEHHNIKPNTIITSGSWDFHLMSTVNTELITFLPSLVSNHFSNDYVVKKHCEQPIPWQVVMCRHKKKLYSRVEDYVFNAILNHFKQKA